MTDYSNIVPSDEIILTGAPNGGSYPHDALVLEIDYRGDEPAVSISTITVWTSSDGIPIEVWEGKIDRWTLVEGAAAVNVPYLKWVLGNEGALSTLIDREIERKKNPKPRASWDQIDEDEDDCDLYNWLCSTSRSQDFVDDSVTIATPGDLFWDSAKIDVTASSTDDELEALAQKYELDLDAVGDDVRIIGSVSEFLRDYRDNYAD